MEINWHQEERRVDTCSLHAVKIGKKEGSDMSKKMANGREHKGLL